MTRAPDAAIDGLQRTLALQRKAFLAAPYPTLAERRRDLLALRRALQRWQDPLARAMSEDFGRRSESECKMLDVLGPALQIDHALGHLRQWMKSERRGVDWMFLGNRARVVYQPKGVVGVIAAWNFPVVESVGPLVAALAAGNRVMVKMSEFSPRCTEVLRRMLADVFPEERVAVFGGGVEVGQAFAGLPLDHVVFTGSPAIGREIMRAAAANLTPVTLELGGKSPAIVGRSASIGTVARSIAHGKLFNSGQACVAPDYALVPPERIDEFVAAAVREFQRMVPDPVTDAHYTSMASDRHADRVRELLADAVAKGATVTSSGAGDGGRIVTLQIVTGVTPQMRIMQEELFNPILPVLACESIDDAIAFVTARPRPLALYYYGSDTREARRLARDVHAGGMTINDWAWHVFQCDLPFGGSGNSGMGSWRGPEGFRALSHAKSVFTVRRWFPIHLFRPPYGSRVQQLVMKLFLGRGPGSDAQAPVATPSRARGTPP
ncbi:aldehyde dehydrogenase family protein [Variovorax sp. J31P179]|uniref:aldehyde dehydrogenase family protein n=1 Tax=Variovorax sp. J31P179 TaxID=3053508 RepID=UPI00257694B1|nr:aldehyde dehydrogenase family protein [Variovorax sp. J31P179]MDM0084908.1 aldehyde dehydrogenase family protein [Variovorax sp. J31P179]